MLNRLYTDLSYLWPIISPPVEHSEDARFFRREFQAKLGPGRHRVLELGVGGGHTLSHLTGDFMMSAVDLSPQMLKLSADLNPNVTHYQGDMRSVRLGKAFDGVMIHDAISHMLTESDLKATFDTAKAHLREGGVLLVTPEWVSESFPGTTLLEWVKTSGSKQITIKEYLHDPDPDDTQIESVYTYMIQDAGKLRVEQDTHLGGLFPTNTWEKLMKQAGFVVEVLSLPTNEGGYGGIMFSGVLGL